MRIAKRTLSVSKKELYEMFNMPHTVEIVGVRTGIDGGIEFQLVSAGEVSVGDTKVTIFQEDESRNYRRLRVSTLQNAEGNFNRNFITDEYKDVQGTLPASSVSEVSEPNRFLSSSVQAIQVRNDEQDKARAEKLAEEMIEAFKRNLSGEQREK